MDIKKYLMILTAVVCFGISAIAQGKTYQVGDLYDENGVKGYVIKVTDGGKHGLLLSLTINISAFSYKDCWSVDVDNKFQTEAFHEDDGAKNMAAIAKFIEENGKSWDDFPIFKWARELGDGWYIPAKDELEDIFIAINGGFGKLNKKTMKKFAKTFKKAGGKGSWIGPMRIAATDDTALTLWSSTEAEGGKAYCSMAKTNLVTGKVTYEITTSNKKPEVIAVRARAVHKF